MMNVSEDTKFSVYLLIDPRDGEIRYVGCTMYLSRRAEQHRNPSQSKGRKQEWIVGLRKQGLKPVLVELVQSSLKDKYWKEEDDWIRRLTLAGCDLVNDSLTAREAKKFREAWIKRRYEIT